MNKEKPAAKKVKVKGHATQSQGGSGTKTGFDVQPGGPKIGYDVEPGGPKVGYGTEVGKKK